MKSINMQILKRFFNKWTIPVFLFIIYIIFNADHGLIENARKKAELKDLLKQEQYLKNKIATDKQRINELQSSQKNLEKFAREQFYMHKDNEDVFIVVEEND